MALSDDLGRDLAERARQLETLERLSQRFGQSLSGALAAGMADGRQLTGVLDDVAASLAKTLSGSLAKTATEGLQGAMRDVSHALLAASFGGAAGFARGGVFGSGGVTPFASGGIVSSPTYFPTRGGLGLMGEAGPEAVMPLARGPDGRLGVRAGGGAAAAPVSVTIQASDHESFRRSEAQVSAAIARAVARGRRAL